MEKIRTAHKTISDPAIVKLIVAALGSLVIYLLAFTLPANLFVHYTNPRLDGHFLPDVGLLGYLRLIIAFIGVGFLYSAGFRIVQQNTSKAAWIIIIGGTLAFIIVFLFMAPFDALDIYDNIFHGRILGIYGANPFHDLISQFPEDPFYKYPRWKDAPSAYGPLWEMLAGLTARLAGNGIIANIFAFKILPGVFHIASIAVVVSYLRRTMPEHTLTGVLLLGWNPVILYEIWGNAHNDMAMIFWVLLAGLLIQQKRYTLSVLSLVLGALVKYIPLLLIPVVIMIGYRNLENVKARISFIFRTSLASLLTVIAAYYPFWQGMASFSIHRRMGMFTTSVPAVIIRFLQPAYGWTEAEHIVSYSALGLLAIFVVIQTFRKQQLESPNAFLQAAFNILAFYLMVTCLWFQQWYGVWLIGLAPLLSERNCRLSLFFGFWVLSKQLIFGPLIVPTMSHQAETAIWLEPILALTVLGVPWLYAILNIRASKQLKVAYAA